MTFFKRFSILTLLLLVIWGVCYVDVVHAREISNTDFLKTDNKIIRNNNGYGTQIILRGVNAGGWLLQEMWMCPTSYNGGVQDQKTLEAKLINRFGFKQAEELLNVYYDNFWTEEDFDICASHGMNVIRLPFWYLNIVGEQGNDKKNGFDRIDWFVREAGKRGIYVILDMHGAPGSQNDEDHSGDVNSNKGLWQGPDVMFNQSLFIKVWEKVAEHYKDNPIVAGYDLLNEPYCAEGNFTNEQVWNLYDRTYDAIRNIDANHIIIMEATWEPYDLPNPNVYGWKNIMYEYHSYNYDNQTDAGAQLTSIKRKLRLINQYNYNVPSYIGETSFFGNMDSWEKCLNELNKAEISWTLWSYKVTGDGSNTWGMYNMNIEKADLDNDSFYEIKRKWKASVTDEKYINKDITAIIDRFISYSSSKVDIGNATVSYIANKIYTSENICPDVIVKYKNNTLTKGIDYRVTYSDNLECGIATITISGMGNFDGVKKTTFAIVPEKISSVSVATQTENSITLRWNKSDNAKGYYIYCYKGGKYVRVADLKPYYDSYNITKLESGSTYDFKICSYITIENDIYEGQAIYIKGSTKVSRVKINKKKVKGMRITINWKKVKGAQGYEIFYYKGKKLKKVKKINSGKTKSYSYKLKESGTYSVKIRAYSKIANKKVYGKFSKKIKIKLKKKR